VYDMFYSFAAGRSQLQHRGRAAATCQQ